MMMTINPNSLSYRLGAIMHSFKVIYTLTPQQVNDFVKSYGVYDYDWINGQATKDSQVMEYSKVKTNLLDWYSVLNHLCAIGQVEKMYIPPALDLSKNVIENQIQFEQRFATILGMKKGDKVLDLGCGKGRVAAHMASFTGADVTGINIDQGQLNDATEFAHKNDLGAQCTFINKDFNDLPFAFADNSFDCIYEIQAFSLSRDLSKLFSELHRILKPGGKMSLLEWVQLPKFDPNNTHHQKLMHDIKPLIGAIGTPTPAELEAQLTKAGFRVLVSEDPSINKSQEPLIDQAAILFHKVVPFIRFLVKFRMLPQHFTVLIDRLNQNAESLCEAVRLGLVTTCYHIVAEK